MKASATGVAFVVVVAALAACTAAPIAEGEGEGEGEDVELVATDYCEQLAPIFCPFYLRCDRINVDGTTDAADELDACIAAFATSCEAGFEPRFTPLADDGLVTLSRAGLDACAAHLDTATCDEQLFELSGPCAGIWEGSVDVGGACGLDAASFVCRPGTTCVIDLSFCGTCDVVLALGDVCRDGDNDVAGTCGPAASCGDDDVCVARPTVNEACVAGGVPCVAPASCGDDGVCHEPAVVVVGEACDRDRRCGYRARCANAVCVATVGPGGACAVDDDCDAGFCVDDVCVAVHAVGEACSDDRECSTGCIDGACAGFVSGCL